MCIFCSIVKKEIPSTVVYEDETLLAFLDNQPATKGHTLIIPKQHFDYLDDCPEEILAKMIGLAKKIAQQYKTDYHATSYNLLLNSGEQSGQAVKHIHLHLIPRYEKGELNVKL